MDRILRRTCAAAAVALALAACAKEGEISYTEQEKLALDAWMRLNRPELVGNYQQQGGYYVDVEKLGAVDSKPINDTACWVRFTFTGRNLGGDIVLTRSETDARQVGTYTPFTHYVPYFKYYAGEINTQLMEGTYLAMRNPLELDAAYAESRGFPTEVLMRYGTKVTLYMPSTVVSSGGVSGSGGYEGQQGYELKSGCPFVVTMEITDTVKNPLQREGSEVDDFAEKNGGLKPVDTGKTDRSAWRRLRGARADGDTPYDDGYAWRNAVDSIPQVYVNLTYGPTDTYDYPHVYPSIYAPYSDFAKLEKDICDTLVNRFGAYAGVRSLDSDSVTLDGKAKIWYIGRFLDGFIFDSNIPGVRRLIYGDAEAKGEAIEYTPSDGGMIEAWYYSVPILRYGQWASILTTSTNAYGSQGQSGTTSTSSTSSNTQNYYDYLNYYAYMNSYYGSGGYYGGYYNNYYNNYLYGQYSGLYGNSNGNTGSTETTVTKVSTEIPPFSPLLFQIYIEPAEEE